MTLSELKKILDATGYPVAYSHFTATTTNPVPKPPYICYLVNGSPNIMADNKVHHKINNLNIELYTNKKDLIAEANLEKILDNNEIPYESYEIYIETEKLFQKKYETRLI
ncbi:phage protein [Bacillus anthracis]|nr:phage protein [Bacillus anthracis]KOS27014.1 phage protein [Bacillus anthracis]